MKNEVEQIILMFIAYLMLWIAVGIHRDNKSKINLFSKWWLIQFVLTMGALIIYHYSFVLDK